MQIYSWANLSETDQIQLLRRPLISSDKTVAEQVSAIITKVKEEGDAALRELTAKFDNVELESLSLTPQEENNALKNVDAKSKRAIDRAILRIEDYQRAMLPATVTVDANDGICCERLPRAIDRVGLYVPGGSAPLISTLMMLAIPASLAGCMTRVLCTPITVNKTLNPALIYAGKQCGIDTIYKLGGAQAIAAMAYGSESITKVDKIFGPGNAWVTEAKIQVSSDPMASSIDMPAGPSEVMVIADEYANPDFVALDLLSQAEHDRSSQTILITDSTDLATKVRAAIDKYRSDLSRKNIIDEALTHSRIIVTANMDDAIAICNTYAPEHLILQIKNAGDYVPYIRNAAAVFIGAWTPETMGDYITGANHVLPTYGYAKSMSGLSVLDFMRYISVQTVTKSGLKTFGPAAITLAELEGLDAHAMAVRVRLESEEICHE